MKKLLYLGLLSVCVLLGSCVEKNVFNAFDKVERYMDVYSDSALLLLEQIPHPRLCFWQGLLQPSPCCLPSGIGKGRWRGLSGRGAQCATALARSLR